MHRSVWVILVLLALGLWLWSQQGARPVAEVSVPAARPSVSPFSPAADQTALPPPSRPASPAYPAFLPREAHDVLDRIGQGGPYEYRQDGGVFQNRERRLPAQPRGYYHEYTVETPGSDDRGARRIITGGEPPREYWYTDDHYRSFRRFEVTR